MPMSALLIAVAAQAAQPQPITVVGNRWAPFISPMGEPFRSRAEGDDTLANWLSQADRDGDGALTQAEMRADAERFFTLLDDDGNGAIDPEEMAAYEWDVAPEVQVNSPRRRARGEPAPVAEPARRGQRTNRRFAPYDPYGLHGAARYTLINMPQPVASADADLNRAVSLAEFRAAADYRFTLLDRAGDRRLELAELRALAPTPTDKRARRPKEGARDGRVAIPVPIGD